jgi:hypothetical protein
MPNNKKKTTKKPKRKITQKRKVIMECGHISLGKDTKTGKPVCPICLGSNPGATKIADKQPSLEGRFAKCDYCKRIAPSSYKLPFFTQGKGEMDSYYCGCRGWD